MARSSLLGTESAAAVPAGRDTAALGPGDSSDSGSDMMGIEDSDLGDPTAPVDVALRDDMPHSLLPDEVMDGGASDAGGTGERRSAGSDAGKEAADIGVDRVFTPGRGGGADADDADGRDLMGQAVAGDPAEDEELDEDDGKNTPPEDESDGPPRARRSGGLRAATPQPPGPRQPVDPDMPGPLEDQDDDGAAPPVEEPDGDAEDRRPGRTAALLRGR